MTTHMTDADYDDRVRANLAVWWATHDVWTNGSNWYTGDPHHRHRYGAGYIKGLPAVDIDDTDRETAERADAMIRAAEAAGTVEHSDPAPQQAHVNIWTIAHLRSVLEVK